LIDDLQEKADSVILVEDDRLLEFNLAYDPAMSVLEEGESRQFFTREGDEVTVESGRSGRTIELNGDEIQTHTQHGALNFTTHIEGEHKTIGLHKRHEVPSNEKEEEAEQHFEHILAPRVLPTGEKHTAVVLGRRLQQAAGIDGAAFTKCRQRNGVVAEILGELNKALGTLIECQPIIERLARLKGDPAIGPTHDDMLIWEKVHALLKDPPTRHELMVTHLQTMWDEVVAPEWERRRPMLALRRRDSDKQESQSRPETYRRGDSRAQARAPWVDVWSFAGVRLHAEIVRGNALHAWIS